MQVKIDPMQPSWLIDMATAEKIICASATHATQVAFFINAVDRLVASLNQATETIKSNSQDLVMIRDNLRELNAGFTAQGAIKKAQQ